MNNPIQIIYKNYYYRLSSYTYKIEKLYIRENILSDDKNLIKSNYKNSSFWGMSNIYSDDYFLYTPLDIICDNSNTSRIYALNIYMDDGLVYYTRTYNKIFLLFSNIFPMFRFLLFFIKKFTQHMKLSFIKKNLIELIFENSKLNPKQCYTKGLVNLNNKLKDNQKNIKIIIGANKSEKEIINYNTNNNIFKEPNILYNKNIICYKINPSSKSHVNEKDISITNSKDKPNSSFEPLKFNENYKNNIINKKRKMKTVFPYYYYFLDIIFDNIINPKQFFCLPKKYFTVYNFMCHIYDISSHIFLFKQFNIINNLSKEKKLEETFYNQFNKININDNQLLDNLRKDINNKKQILFNNYFVK